MSSDLFSHKRSCNMHEQVDLFLALKKMLGGRTESGGSKFVRGSLEFHITQEERVITHTAAPLS